MSWSLGTVDWLSTAYRPSRAVHLALSRCRGERYGYKRVVFQGRLHYSRKSSISNSYLRCAFVTITQYQTTVKLYGVFASGWKRRFIIHIFIIDIQNSILNFFLLYTLSISHWRSVAYSPQSSFTESRFGTVRKSLSHSSGPSIKRQEITLLYDTQS